MAELVDRNEWTRRTAFYLFVLLTMGTLTWMFADLLWRVDFSVLKFFLVVVFSLLTYPIALGFWQCLAGLLARRNGNSYNGGDGNRVPLPAKLVAVNIPVYNEDIGQVLSRLEVLYRSLEEAGQVGTFDFYILSDSNKADNWVAEEYGWARLCRNLGAFDRIFYRRRKRNIHQKAGNLLNFCESWGRRYKYMVILDADSLMSGDALVRMTVKMEADPRLGILQTVPQLTRARTRYALMQQFANRVYGPVFARGLAFWQGDHGNYWGHNAMLRVEPFIKHCALPDLPGRPPWGGKILSHDFVEAALMIRAGYAVRMDFHESGSYEEGPADLLESAVRDRRWCQGNLQHFWLLFADKLRWTSKLHFINGIFAYIGSFLWFLFLVLSLALSFEWKKSDLTLIPVHGTSPLGMLSISQHALLLFVIILSLLIFPKVACLGRAILMPDQRKRGGGAATLVLLGLAETVFSTLVAPILMIFHTRFILLTLFGRGISWTPQARSSSGLSWMSTARGQWLHTLAGLVVTVIGAKIGPVFLAWISPIWIGLVFSIPLTVLSSRHARGYWSRHYTASLEQSAVELELGKALADKDLGLSFFSRTGSGFQNVVVDPIFNAVHLSLLRESAEGRDPREIPGPAFFRYDPTLLLPDRCLELLESVSAMRELHRLVWRLPEEELHPQWRNVLERYTLQPIFQP